MIDKNATLRVIEYLRAYTRTMNIPCVISGSQIGGWHVTIVMECPMDLSMLSTIGTTLQSGKFYFTDPKIAPYLSSSDDAVPIRVALPEQCICHPTGWVHT